MKTTYILLENSQVMAFEGPVKPEQSGDAYTTDKRLERWDHEMFESKASRLPAVNVKEFLSDRFGNPNITNEEKFLNHYTKVLFESCEVVPLPGWKLDKVYEAWCGFDEGARWMECRKEYYYKYNTPTPSTGFRQAYRLVREEPNGIELNHAVIDEFTTPYPLEHKTPNQDDFETEEDFFNACKKQREHKTQDDTILCAQSVHTELVNMSFERGLKQGEANLKEWQDAHANICEQKNAVIAALEQKLKFMSPNTDTQESQEELFREVVEIFNAHHKLKGRPDYELLKKRFILTRRNP